MSVTVELLGVPRFDGPPREPLSPQTVEAARRLMDRYPDPRSALLPMLYLVQAEHGFVSREGMTEVAGLLGLTSAEVAAVATFYTMFKREPLGRWLVSVCTQPPCALAGALDIKKALEEELGITCGQTSTDGSITLEDVECLCICDGAPAFQVNYENYERMTPAEALELIATLRSGGTPPKPARGEVPQPNQSIYVELSGLAGVSD
jgi:NADH-quinone oxidoreductase subunit E